MQSLRHLAATLAVLLGLGALVAAAGGGASTPAPEAPRYLALGDSLAASVQADVPSDDGYAEALWRRQGRHSANLVLVKLGRGGETSASMIRGSRPGLSQLERAENVLRSRRTALVTLDIGANEVESCRRGAGFERACVERALASLRRSLPRVLDRLKTASRGATPIVGINYYNSFLGRWVDGAQGRLLARRSVPVERRLNATLAEIYGRAHVPVADVENAFATKRLGSYVSVRPYGRAPLAVARVCRWTGSCADEGDDHTNSAGYRVIAGAVTKVLDGRR